MYLVPPLALAQPSVIAEQGNAQAGPHWVKAAGGHPAHQLLKKLRWCTLGPQFDWTARVYDRHAPYSPLPEELRALALRLCASAAPSLPNLTAGMCCVLIGRACLARKNNKLMLEDCHMPFAPVRTNVAECVAEGLKMTSSWCSSWLGA